MADSNYIGQVILFAGKYVIEGWMPCEGQLLNIKDHQALYTIIGAIYGGDDIKTFALPDLRGAVPIGSGAKKGATAYPTSSVGGQEKVSSSYLLPLPEHTHEAKFTADAKDAVNPVKIAVDTSSASGANNVHSPADAYLANAFSGTGSTQVRAYSTNDPGTNAAHLAGVSGGGGGGISGGKVTVTSAGTKGASLTLNVDVRQPYVALRYLICVAGVGEYPPRSEDYPSY